jgi:hypothetical protein
MTPSNYDRRVAETSAIDPKFIRAARAAYEAAEVAMAKAFEARTFAERGSRMHDKAFQNWSLADELVKATKRTLNEALAAAEPR